jgi:hypothetical protein
MTVTQKSIDFYGRTVCMPVALLINFSLFQYLATTYFRRRNDRRVILLLACSIAAFVCLIPISHPNDKVVNDLNDISEILSTMTFLIQITMIGRDMNRKMRVRSLAWSARAAELLTLFGIILVIKLLLELAFPHIDFYRLDEADNIMENVSLAFVLFFRVFYVSQIRGIRATLATKKSEIALYLLFVTHEYPFMVLNAATDLDWEEVQAVWNRVTMAACLVHTIRQKIKMSSSSKRANSTKFVTATSVETPPVDGPSKSRVWSVVLARPVPAVAKFKSISNFRAVAPARSGGMSAPNLLQVAPGRH